MTAPTTMSREQLQAALQGSDALQAMLAAQMAADPELFPNEPIYITVHDKFWKPIGECYNYNSVSFGFPRNAADTMKLILAGDDPIADIALTCNTTLVPILAEVGYLRWAGWVDIALDKFDGKMYTVECSCISIYAMLSRVVAWPAPELPIQVQFPNHGVDFGGCVTVLERFMEIQFLRLQSGIWELVNNLGSLNFDWRAWFGTWLAGNGDIIDMLRTPFVVLRTNPLFDTSPFVSINWRMDKLDTLIAQTVKDNGLVVSVDLWKPGDPQPPGLIFPLDQPTYVVSVKNRSGRTGPTNTFLDGFFLDLADLEDSTVGEQLKPFLNPGNEYAPDGVAIAPVLGINFVPPWVIFTDHKRGGLTEFEFAHHAPLAWQIVSGGKSPKWMNDLINATLEFFIDALMIVLGFTGVPSDILDGMFDDILLAFQLVENFDRRIAMGPYGPPEMFFPTGSSAFTLDAFFAQIKSMWDTKGYVSAKVSFNDAYPYRLGRDIFSGAMALIVRRNKLFAEYIENVEVNDDRQNGFRKIKSQIGDGQAEEAPIVKSQRRLTSFEEALNILTLSSN